MVDITRLPKSSNPFLIGKEKRGNDQHLLSVVPLPQRRQGSA
jgi:hypothetical protein